MTTILGVHTQTIRKWDRGKIKCIPTPCGHRRIHRDEFQRIIKGMMKNRKLALSIADVGWGEFSKQLKYKCEWYRSTLVEATRFFPSSEMF